MRIWSDMRSSAEENVCLTFTPILAPFSAGRCSIDVQNRCSNAPSCHIEALAAQTLFVSLYQQLTMRLACVCEIGHRGVRNAREHSPVVVLMSVSERAFISRVAPVTLSNHALQRTHAQRMRAAGGPFFSRPHHSQRYSCPAQFSSQDMHSISSSSAWHRSPLPLLLPVLLPPAPPAPPPPQTWTSPRPPSLSFHVAPRGVSGAARRGRRRSPSVSDKTHAGTE